MYLSVYNIMSTNPNIVKLKVEGDWATDGKLAFTKDVYEVKWDDVEQFIVKNKRCHEIIQGPCKPYYDVELYYATEDERAEAFKDDYADCKDALEELFPYSKYKGRRIVYLCASGKSANPNKADKPYVNSIHAIVNGVGYCESGLDVPQHAEFTALFDNQVYVAAGKSKNFRTIFSHKHADPKRPFLPLPSRIKANSIGCRTSQC